MALWLVHCCSCILTYIRSHSCFIKELRTARSTFKICSADANILCFYGTWNLITLFGKVPHRNLYWNTFIQSTTSHPVSHRSLLIASSLLRLRLKWSIPSGSTELCILISRVRAMSSDFLILKVRDDGVLIQLLTFWTLSTVPFLYLKQQLCLRAQVKGLLIWALKRYFKLKNGTTAMSKKSVTAFLILMD
jgi:hypothetical protein